MSTIPLCHIYLNQYYNRIFLFILSFFHSSHVFPPRCCAFSIFCGAFYIRFFISLLSYPNFYFRPWNLGYSKKTSGFLLKSFEHDKPAFHDTFYIMMKKYVTFHDETSYFSYSWRIINWFFIMTKHFMMENELIFHHYKLKYDVSSWQILNVFFHHDVECIMKC